MFSSYERPIFQAANRSPVPLLRYAIKAPNAAVDHGDPPKRPVDQESFAKRLGHVPPA